MSDNKYCYPNSNVLINKLNIRDQNELNSYEAQASLFALGKLLRNPIKGNFDLAHLCSIHLSIFEDVYGWAGLIREVDIHKGTMFCPCQNIVPYSKEVFDSFYTDCQRVKKNQKAFAQTLAKHYADLNALHPFREGNGRAQREFVRELCQECGYYFDLSHTTHEEMLNASIASFYGNTRMLSSVFEKSLSPLNPHVNRQKISIFSKDDYLDDYDFYI